ncbi:hypothetical protein NDU88_005021 [Pleurodeles waltl]|uniref:Uncharacterized protein n=1 Tax=Pleurodeles waltl TaxID=8319 RepID=A0AAV7T9S5_PLEWA|nr:hypothetical protein NDU88_005021 [Pleurodeles waltl]
MDSGIFAKGGSDSWLCGALLFPVPVEQRGSPWLRQSGLVSRGLTETQLAHHSCQLHTTAHYSHGPASMRSPAPVQIRPASFTQSIPSCTSDHASQQRPIIDHEAPPLLPRVALQR